MNNAANASVFTDETYKPAIDRLSGFDAKTANPAAVERLQRIMCGYSNSVVQFLTGFPRPTSSTGSSTTPASAPRKNRAAIFPLRRRNDLLHTGRFPHAPHPRRAHSALLQQHSSRAHPRLIVSDPFAATVRRFAPKENRPAPRLCALTPRQNHGPALSDSAPPSPPSSARLRRLHDALPQFLKRDPRFQADCPKISLQFPSGSSWMVYTDTVPHAVLAGQYALEQTFLVRPEAMVRPEISPLRILEKSPTPRSFRMACAPYASLSNSVLYFGARAFTFSMNAVCSFSIQLRRRSRPCRHRHPNLQENFLLSRGEQIHSIRTGTVEAL